MLRDAPNKELASKRKSCGVTKASKLARGAPSSMKGLPLQACRLQVSRRSRSVAGSSLRSDGRVPACCNHAPSLRASDAQIGHKSSSCTSARHMHAEDIMCSSSLQACTKAASHSLVSHPIMSISLVCDRLPAQ